MIATASAVNFCGAKPIPVDINWDDGLINPLEIEKKINKKTKAILITHLNGRTCDMDKILKIKKNINCCYLKMQHKDLDQNTKINLLVLLEMQVQ